MSARGAKVLLLNPPAEERVSRDCFLGVEAEDGLRLPPADLACLSGTLARRGEVAVIDAAAEGLSARQVSTRVAAASPDVLVFLSSGLTYAADAALLSGLKQALPKTRFVGIGDIYNDAGELAFSLQPFLDAVLFDFSTDDLLRYLEPGGEPIDNMIFRSGADLVRGAARRGRESWDLPAPRWDLFPLKRYRSPLAPAGPSAAVLSDYGCPYLCTYCPASSLGHRFRPVAAVLEEVRGLRALGVKSVVFRDQTFGFHRRRAEELLEGLAKLRPAVSWSCSTRVDLAEAGLFSLMKRAGCAAVAFGIDSGDDEVLRAYKKNTTRAQAAEAVRAAKDAGLQAWGLVLIGLPLDTRQTVERTLEFAGGLGLDRVSYRVESSRHAADYRRDMLVRGLVPPEAMPPDVPTSVSVWQGRLGLSNPDALRFYEQAVRSLARA